MVRTPTAFALLCASVLLGCGPGDGSTLDERGRSAEHPLAPGLGSTYGAVSFAPTYREVVGEFFGRFCVGCHSGTSAPRGLDLTESEAYDNLVGVPAVGRPSMLLVDPDDPARSYLLLKLEGGAEISGQRMPRNRPSRPRAEIDTIYDWIALGAARS